MKHKKLFALMIIVSTLLACSTMNISASDIWNGNGDEEAYIIEGWLFSQLDENYPIDWGYESYEQYSAYIMYDNQQLYVMARVDVELYLFASENFEIELDVNDLEIYINKPLYDYWLDEEGGGIPTIGVVTAGGGAKEVFDVATDVTREVAFGFFNAFWNNGLTFWGWLIAISFGLITTFNIIKMISNSL